MGTIDISYLSLGIGLLLLSIPLLYMEIQDRPATCNPYRYGTHDCAAFLHRHLSEIPFSLE